MLFSGRLWKKSSSHPDETKDQQSKIAWVDENSAYEKVTEIN